MNGTSQRSYETTYSYFTDEGIERLRKKRYRVDPPVRGRAKTFQVGHRRLSGTYVPSLYCEGGCDVCDLEPDSLIYQWPAVQVAIKEEEPVYVVDGEKDVHTALGLGVVATTTWQGSGGGWNEDQLIRLNGARVVLVVDKDAAGAYGAVRFLAGMDGTVLSVVKARAGKDLTDHVTQGFGLDDLAPVNLEKMRAVAETYELPGTLRRSFGGYR